MKTSISLVAVSSLVACLTAGCTAEMQESEGVVDDPAAASEEAQRSTVALKSFKTTRATEWRSYEGDASIYIDVCSRDVNGEDETKCYLSIPTATLPAGFTPLIAKNVGVTYTAPAARISTQMYFIPAFEDDAGYNINYEGITTTWKLTSPSRVFEGLELTCRTGVSATKTKSATARQTAAMTLVRGCLDKSTVAKATF